MAPATPLPKYHQIYLVLREHVAEGRYGDGLPGELQLVRQFGVARSTVRKALERLETEGLIDRRPGRGTRLLKTMEPAAGKTAQLGGLLENIVSMGLRTQVKVLSCSMVGAPVAISRRLMLPPGSHVQRAVRVRSNHDGPLSHITTWVPAGLARGFGRRELAHEPILLLLERAGVHIGRAAQSISACPAE